MKFRRWLFYRPTTGEVQYVGMQQGDFTPAPVEDFASALSLSECAYMEWTEPDPEVEAAFAPVDAEGKPRMVNVSVDVSGTEPQLVFAYEAVPEPEQSDVEDMAAALMLLGVTPKETEE